MTLKRLQFTVILGFLLRIGIACSADQNEPLDPPFESLIPKCEYFAPLFDSAKAKMIGGGNEPLQVAQRWCSGNQIELRMRLYKLSDSAESSRWMEEAVENWNDLGVPTTTLRSDFDQLDGYFEVDIGNEAECLDGPNDQFFYGSALLSYIQVGNFVGEYELDDCTEDKHLKDYWSDFGELAARLDLVNFSPKNRAIYGLPSFEEQLLEEIAIPETGLRIRRLID